MTILSLKGIVACQGPFLEGHELGHEPGSLDRQDDHGMGRRGPPLGRRAGVQDPEVLEALDLRHVGVPVDDDLTVLEAGGQTRLAALALARVVDHPDPHPSHLDDSLPRQRFLQRGLVHVPGDGLERRPELSERIVELLRDEVAGMEQKIRGRDQANALVRQRTCSARQMGVGDDRDAGQEAVTGSGWARLARGSFRNSPARQTSSPSA